MIESAEEFVRLRTSDNPAEYRRAALESADEAVWLDAIERFLEMRKWVAHNKTVPLSILRLLARDDDVMVRQTVAMKRKLDSDLFTLLSDDPDASVRQQVACNANVPHALLLKLSQDGDWTVSEAAQSRL